MAVIWAAAIGALAAAAGGISSASGAKKKGQAQGAAIEQSLGDISDFSEEELALIDENTALQQGNLRRFGKKQNQLLKKGNGKILDILNLMDERVKSQFPTFNELNVQSFIEPGKAFVQEAFEFDNKLKDKQLRSALGADAFRDLSKSRDDFAALAAGNTQAFQRELRASAYGALAGTQGDATIGTFANTSANNLLRFRNQGADSATKLGDFFYTRGTANPAALGEVAFNLFKVGASERDSRLQYDIGRLSALDAADNRRIGFLENKSSRTGALRESLFNVGNAINQTAFAQRGQVRRDQLNAGINLRAQAAQLQGLDQAFTGAALSTAGASAFSFADAYSNHKALQQSDARTGEGVAAANQTASTYRNMDTSLPPVTGGTSSYTSYGKSYPSYTGIITGGLSDDHPAMQVRY
ncbi:MAG: hypothetical protein ACRCWR_01810 [Saezia sp.]